MSNLCADCRDEWWRWLDTKPSMLRSGLHIASHAAYDDTGHGIETNRRNRHADWVALVRRQQKLIEEQCPQQHVLGQLSLFEAAA
jgi:phenylalanine-4-hydroxylase